MIDKTNKSHVICLHLKHWEEEKWNPLSYLKTGKLESGRVLVHTLPSMPSISNNGLRCWIPLPISLVWNATCSPASIPSRLIIPDKYSKLVLFIMCRFLTLLMLPKAMFRFWLTVWPIAAPPEPAIYEPT